MRRTDDDRLVEAGAAIQEFSMRITDVNNKVVSEGEISNFRSKPPFPQIVIRR